MNDVVVVTLAKLKPALSVEVCGTEAMVIDMSAANTALRQKMNRLADLSDSDDKALETLVFQRETIRANRYLVREGEEVSRCCLLIEGYACRDKLVRMGERQIVSFHMPGDLLDLQHSLLPTADHNLSAITAVTVGWIARETLLDLARERPRIAEAFAKDALIDASIFREWVLNVGRRDAKTRVAHMLCEFVTRRKTIGIPPEAPVPLPFTQQQIADATGLTAVHVNRMLRALRDEGAFEYGGRALQIADWRRLKTIAEFDAAYLHQAA
jgi:CRP-like cAMP-binding protein